MNSGWKKYFADGSSEAGSDIDVANKTASWSRGKLKHMLGVRIFHNKECVILITGYGEYHQSDEFEASIYQSQPSRVVRRIQKRITQQDKYIVGQMTDNQNYISLYCGPGIHPRRHYSVFYIPNNNEIDQWLTVEYDIKYDKIGMYVTKERL